MAQRLDFRTVKFRDREEFTDWPKGRRREVDVLVEVRTLAGDPELILVHIEAQSRREADFGERMCRYYWLLSLRHPYPVLPLALLIQRGVGGIGWDTYTRAVFDEHILTFRYGRVGLLDLRDEDYLMQNNPLAIALAARMRHRRGSQLNFKLRCVERLEHTPLNPGKKHLLVQAVDHFLPLAPDQEVELLRLVERKRLKEVRPMLGGVERLGLTKGIVQGKQEIVLDLFQTRFGKVPSTWQKRIRAMTDPDLLSEMARRLMTADSPEDLEDALVASSKSQE